jgi:hypothetical protein
MNYGWSLKRYEYCCGVLPQLQYSLTTRRMRQKWNRKKNAPKKYLNETFETVLEQNAYQK